MGFNDRRKERLAERRERRATRGKTALERAEQRERERDGENGDGATNENGNGDGGQVAALPVASSRESADGNDGKGGRRRFLALAGGRGGGDPDAPAKPKLKKLRAALVVMGLALLALVSWVFGIMTAVAGDLPELENRAQFERAENSVIVDRNGTRLATLTNNEGRILVSSDEIAPVMKEAVVAIEDQRFYEHRGVDFQGIARALYQDVLAGSAEQGASTITQQFVKNALAAQDDRTILQKLREAALAYQLERHWSKDKILTEYLNSIYFGEGAYGIEAAAHTYFGAAHPGCGEEGQPSLRLRAPSLRSGHARGDHRLAVRLLAAGPTGSGENSARPGSSEHGRSGLHHVRGADGLRDSAPPRRFADPAAGRQFRRALLHLLAPPAARRPLRRRRGVRRRPYRAIHARSGPPAAGGGHCAQPSRIGVGLDSSIVVLDNETSGVLAMVGGNDFEKQPFNLATNGLRQPGSSFKPFTLVTALEQGHSTDEVFNSAQVNIPFKVKAPKKNGKGFRIVQDLFRVNNYGDNYLGPVSLFTGTTFSDNSVYSQLGTQVGVDKVAETAGRLGIQHRSLRSGQPLFDQRWPL